MNFIDFNMGNISILIMLYNMMSTASISNERDVFNLSKHLQAMIVIYDSSGFYLKCQEQMNLHHTITLLGIKVEMMNCVRHHL